MQHTNKLNGWTAGVTFALFVICIVSWTDVLILLEDYFQALALECILLKLRSELISSLRGDVGLNSCMFLVFWLLQSSFGKELCITPYFYQIRFGLASLAHLLDLCYFPFSYLLVIFVRFFFISYCWNFVQLTMSFACVWSVCPSTSIATSLHPQRGKSMWWRMFCLIDTPALPPGPCISFLEHGYFYCLEGWIMVKNWFPGELLTGLQIVIAIY